MSTKPEQYLKVGDWWYLPQQDKLVKLSEAGTIEQTAELDNLCQKALNYFILNAGRLVTRDELLADVWGVRDVSDGRISRVIRVLRVVLGDDSREPTYIETIPKRGFRFVASVVEVLSPSAELTQLPAPEPITKRSAAFYATWIAVASSLCCALIYGSWLHWQDPAQATASVPFGRLEPVSSMDGLEFFPSTSSDGRYLAYTHSKDLVSPSSIVVQDLQSLEKTILRTSENTNLVGPVWHPHARILAYQELKRKVSCEIRVLRFDAQFQVQADELLTPCSSQSMGARMSWSPDGRFLVYPDWQEKTNKIALMMYAWHGGKVEQLTMPPETSMGDFAAAFAKDGNSLAFIRDVSGAAGQIWLLNIVDRSIKMLIQPEGIYPGQVAWLPETPEILYPSGANELSVINIHTLQNKVYAHTDNKAGEVTMNPDGRIFASVGKLWQSSIRRISNPLKNSSAINEVLQQSSPSEGILELNPDPAGPTAVMSNRSGVQQVWLYFKDGQQKQISQFTGDFIPKSLEFSPDGNYLVALVGASVWLLSEEGEPVLLSQPGQDSRDPSWSHDSKTIYFSTSYQGQWRIIAMDIYQREQKVFAVDMDYFRESPDGNYHVWRNSADKLIRIQFKQDSWTQVIPVPINQEFFGPTLVLRPSAVYFLDKNPAQQHEIHSFDLATRTVQRTGVMWPTIARRFTVSADEQFILQDDGKTGDIDIAELVFTQSTL